MPILNAIIQGTYLGSQAIRQAANDLGAFNRVQLQSNAYTMAASGVQNTFNQLFGRTGTLVNNTTRGMQGLNRQTRDSHLHFMSLFKVVVMVEGAMTALKAIMYPSTFLQESAEKAKNYSYAMAQANVVLGDSQAHFKGLKKEVLLTSASLGQSADKAANAMLDISHGMNAINLQTSAGMLTAGQGALKIFEESANLARVTGMEQSEAHNALARSMNVLGLNIGSTHDVAATLFQTYKSGIMSASDLAGGIGLLNNSLGFLTTGMKEQQKLKFFQEQQMAWSALTHIMDSPEAVTSLNNFNTTLFQTSSEAERMKKTLKSAYGIDMSAEKYIRVGPAQFFNEMFEQLGRNGPLVEMVMKKYSSLGKIQDENARRSAIQATIFGSLFGGNIRTLRGVLSLGIEEAQLFKRVLEDAPKSIENYNNAIKIMQQETKFASEKLGTTWSAFGMMLVENTLPRMTQGMNILQQSIMDTMKLDDFDKMTFRQKIDSLLNTVNDGLRKWWTSGGANEWRNFWSNFGYESVGFAHGLVGGAGHGVGWQMGSTAGSNFIGGMKDYIIKNLPRMLFDAFGSDIIQGIMVAKATGSPYAGVAAIAAKNLIPSVVKEGTGIPEEKTKGILNVVGWGAAAIFSGFIAKKFGGQLISKIPAFNAFMGSIFGSVGSVLGPIIPNAGKLMKSSYWRTRVGVPLGNMQIPGMLQWAQGYMSGIPGVMSGVGNSAPVQAIMRNPWMTARMVDMARLVTPIVSALPAISRIPAMMGQTGRWAGRTMGIGAALNIVSETMGDEKSPLRGFARGIFGLAGSIGGGIAGAAGMGAAGAAIGTAGFPGIGTAIGGVYGLGAGGIAGGTAGQYAATTAFDALFGDEGVATKFWQSKPSQQPMAMVVNNHFNFDKLADVFHADSAESKEQLGNGLMDVLARAMRPAAENMPIMAG